MIALKRQYANDQFALEKLTGETSRTEVDLQAQMVDVVEGLTSERVHVKRFEEAVVEAKMRYQLLAERQETSQTASRSQSENEEFL